MLYTAAAVLPTHMTGYGCCRFFLLFSRLIVLWIRYFRSKEKIKASFHFVLSSLNRIFAVERQMQNYETDENSMLSQ